MLACCAQEGRGSEHVEGLPRSCQAFWVAAQELADGFFAPARLFPGGIVTLGLSCTGPLVAVHHAGPDLCPTLQGANITLERS